MAEVAAKVRDTGPLHVLKKRWRAWLRAVHRDAGYLAIGFTVIYAISGIAQNHIEDWGDVSYKATERTVAIPAIPADTPDDVAIRTVAAVAGLGTPTTKLRAGDEIRLEYANGAKATAIGTQLTIQSRERRAFIGAANWLHTARNKKGWKYVADGFAVFLLYLAISGIFMIKGRLGLKWRGAVLISLGVAVPVIAVLTSSPQPKAAEASESTTAAAPAPTPTPAAPTEDGSAGAAETVDTSGIKFLPPEENE
ncbi:MAG: hypothetical protein HOV81_18600 [Kofleriaceae bacterium]|nr:hypothetical protein [Kofleriaceae bacterium]